MTDLLTRDDVERIMEMWWPNIQKLCRDYLTLRDRSDELEKEVEVWKDRTKELVEKLQMWEEHG